MRVNKLLQRVVLSKCAGPSRPATSKAASPSFSAAVAGSAGFAGGTLGALCGVGGGLVLIPTLKHFGGGLSAHQVGATAMFALTMGSGVGASTYLLEGTANVPTSAAVFCGSSLFSVAGSRFAALLPGTALSLLTKGILLGAIPLCLSKTQLAQTAARRLQYEPPEVLIRRRPSLSQTVRHHHVTVREAAGALWASATGGAEVFAAAATGFFREHREHVAIGALSGFASGLLGVGGGLLMMTLLGHSMPQHEAVATCIVALLPTGAITSMYNLATGSLRLRVGLVVGGANMLGMLLGAKALAPHADEDLMRYVFAGLMLVALAK